MDLTIAICTFRRAELLPVTLSSFAAVARPEGLRWELLIVDNGCEDRVAEVVRGFADRLPVRYEREAVVGIAHARNRAVQSTDAPLIVYADDDVLFDPHWLVNMVRATREHADCAFWGGRIHPVWQVDRPRWFDVERCPMLGDSVVKYDLGEQPRYWSPDPPHQDPPFYTANLALRTDAIKKAGYFDVTLGHSGTKRGSGEDSWMIKTIHRAGGRGWYAADAVLHHPVEPKRLTKPYARRFAWRQGKVSVEMLRRENAPVPESGAGNVSKGGKVPRWLYRFALGQTFHGLGQWTVGCLSFDPGLAFAGQYLTIFNLSKLVHTIKK